MDRAGQFFFQSVIYEPLARHPINAGKSRRFDSDVKMGFPFRLRAGMSRMFMRIVGDDKPGRCERIR